MSVITWLMLVANVRSRGCTCAVEFDPRPSLWGVPVFRAVHEGHCRGSAAKPAVMRSLV